MLTARAGRATAVAATMAAALATFAATPASADGTVPVADGDVLIANHGFDDGLSGWTATGRPSAAACTGAVTATSAGWHGPGARLATTATCTEAELASGAVKLSNTGMLTAFAHARLASGQAFADVDVFDASGAIIAHGQQAIDVSTDWSQVRVQVDAPASAVSAAVSFRLAGTGAQLAVDEVLLSPRLTKVGSPLHTSSANGTAIGTDEQGRPTAYTVITGAHDTPAQLAVVDLATGAVRHVVQLAGSIGSWTAVQATDGTVYVGGYTYDGATGAHLYRYVPGQDTATDLGQMLPGASFAYGLTAGPNGSVFAGGYPTGEVWQYIPGQGFKRFGAAPLIADSQYTRDLSYAPDLGILYVGTGTKAHTLACDVATEKCTDVLPQEYLSEPWSYSVQAGANGDVYSFLYNSSRAVAEKVTKAADGTITAGQSTLINGVIYPGLSPEHNGVAYYVSTSYQVMAYDSATGTTHAVAPLGMSLRELGIVTVPGTDHAALAGIGNSGGHPVAVMVDLVTGQVTKNAVTDAPGAPVDIEYLAQGPDQNIYAGGYLVGGLASYQPMRSDTLSQQLGVGQTEGMISYGDTLYLGVYPGGRIQAYHPGPVVAGSNPKTLCDLSEQGQDRPYGVAAGDGLVFFGTMAAYGHNDGALTVLDPTTGQCQVYRDVVHDQTIASLAYLDGKVYGGSLIFGGLGTNPTQTEAKLLVFDVKTRTSKVVDLPTPGLRNVTGVTVGPDHRIWMTAQDHLLVYDPATGQWTHDSVIVPGLSYPAGGRITAYDSFLRTGRDGNVYATLHGTYLLRIDPHSMQATVLYKGNPNLLTEDAYGNLYFADHGADLVRYVP